MRSAWTPSQTDYVVCAESRLPAAGANYERMDAHGPVPEEVGSLLALAEIRVLCKGLSISTIKERNGFAQIEFGKVANISIEKVLGLIAESAGKVKLDSRHPNYLLIETGKIGLAEKSIYLREKREKLSA